MAIARETYFIYLRNIRVWVSQPMAVVGPLLSTAMIFVLFGAPLSALVDMLQPRPAAMAASARARGETNAAART